jgi:hypothetical protein
VRPPRTVETTVCNTHSWYVAFHRAYRSASPRMPSAPMTTSCAGRPVRGESSLLDASKGGGGGAGVVGEDVCAAATATATANDNHHVPILRARQLRHRKGHVSTCRYFVLRVKRVGHTAVCQGEAPHARSKPEASVMAHLHELQGGEQGRVASLPWR